MRKTKAKSKGKKPHSRKKLLTGQKYTRMHIFIRKQFFLYSEGNICFTF